MFGVIRLDTAAGESIAGVGVDGTRRASGALSEELQQLIVRVAVSAGHIAEQQSADIVCPDEQAARCAVSRGAATTIESSSKSEIARRTAFNIFQSGNGKQASRERLPGSGTRSAPESRRGKRVYGARRGISAKRCSVSSSSIYDQEKRNASRRFLDSASLRSE
jgi:hypothetical protein